MFLVLSPVKAVVFIIVQQALSGLYLGSSFAPTTSAMPVLAADDQSDFLRRHACGRGMDGKEDVELRAEAGNAQEPASWARARSAARRHRTARHHARCPSNGGAAVSRHLIRDRPVTSRLAAGGAGQGLPADSNDATSGPSAERGDDMGALGPGGEAQPGKAAGVRVPHRPSGRCPVNLRSQSAQPASRSRSPQPAARTCRAGHHAIRDARSPTDAWAAPALPPPLGCGCPPNRRPAPAIGGRPFISSGGAPSPCG
jgi:hypothetical protein